MIKFRNISKTGLLEDIHVTIYQGELFCFISEDKKALTALLQLVNGLQEATTGTIQYEGRTISKLSGKPLLHWRQKLGYVTAEPSLFTEKTVAENIAMPLRIAGMRERLIEQRVVELLQFLGMLEHKHARVQSLSAGERLRVAMARAIAADVYMLLCDDIFSSLTAAEKKEAVALLEAIHREQGITVLMTATELTDVQHICQRFAIIHERKVVETATLFECVAHPKHPYTKTLVAPLFTMQLTPRMLAPLSGMLVRVVVQGSANGETTIAEMIKQFTVNVTILQGAMHYIRGEALAIFIFNLQGHEIDVALAKHFLEQRGAVVEVLNRHELFAFEC